MNKTLFALALLVLLASSAFAQAAPTPSSNGSGSTYNYYNQPTVIPGQQPSRISQADIERALRKVAEVYGQVQGRFIAEQQIGYKLPNVTQSTGASALLGSLQQYVPNGTPQAAASANSGAQSALQTNPFLTYGYNQEVTDLFGRDAVRQAQGQQPLYDVPQYNRNANYQSANYAQAPPALQNYREVRLIELRDRSVSPGEVEIFDVEVRNTTFATKDYALRVDSEDQRIKSELSDRSFTLAANETRIVKVLVKPGKATKGGAKVVYLVVTSSTAGSGTATGPEYDADLAVGAMAPSRTPQKLVVSLEDFSKPIKPESVVLKVNKLEYDTGAKGFDVQYNPGVGGSGDKISLSIAEDFFMGSEPAKVEVFFTDTFNNAYSLSFDLVPTKHEVKARNLEFKAQVYKALTYGRELRNAYFRAQASNGRYLKENAYKLNGPQAFVKIEQDIPVGTKSAFEFYAEDQFGTYFKMTGSYTIQFFAPQGYDFGQESMRQYGNKLEYREALTFNMVEKPVQAGLLVISGYPAEISLKAGETRNIEVLLANKSLETLKDLDVTFVGLPAGMNASTAHLEDLAPGKTTAVKVDLRSTGTEGATTTVDLVADAVGAADKKPVKVTVEARAKEDAKKAVEDTAKKETAKTTAPSALTNDEIKAEVERMITALQTDGLKTEAAQKIRETIPMDFAVKVEIVNAKGETVDTLYGIKKGKDLFVTKTYDGIVNTALKMDIDTVTRLGKENLTGAYGQSGLVSFGLSDQRVTIGIIVLVVGAIAIILLLRDKEEPKDKFFRRRLHPHNLQAIKARVH